MNAVAAAKFAEFSVVPEANFTILVIVAPASVFVNVLAALPVPCAVVNVTEPAVSEPIVSLGVPNDAFTPLKDAPLNVATLDSRVAVIV